MMMNGTIYDVERKGGNAKVRPDVVNRLVILKGSAGKQFFIGQRVLYDDIWPLEKFDLAQRYEFLAQQPERPWSGCRTRVPE
jgi:hypothetical protein